MTAIGFLGAKGIGVRRRRLARGVLAGCLALAGLASATCGASAKSKDQAENQETISKTLQASAAAWSRGDLAGFMQGYEESPNTEYVKNTGVVQGFAAIKDMYAAKYGAGGHAMGRLSLELMAYRQLGAAYGLVTGRYSLTRAKAEGGDASGVFTLIFHRGGGGWHIIYDHTS